MQTYNYLCASNINSHIPITPDIYIEVEYTDRNSTFFFPSFQSNSRTAAKL